MSKSGMSRSECVVYAKGFYPHPAKVRAYTAKTKWGVRVACGIVVDGKIVGQGEDWPLAYLNMRANLRDDERTMAFGMFKP